MGKALVIVLATLAGLGILVYCVGGTRMSTTALNVPGTEHTPAFGITWTVIGALVLGGVFYKLVKGK